VNRLKLPGSTPLQLDHPRLHHHPPAAEADAPFNVPFVLSRERRRDLRASAASIESAAPASLLHGRLRESRLTVWCVKSKTHVNGAGAVKTAPFVTLIRRFDLGDRYRPN